MSSKRTTRRTVHARQAPGTRSPEFFGLADSDDFDDDETRVVDLLDNISRQPDGDAKLAFIIKTAADWRTDEAEGAARELAGAFATIEQWRDYLPASVYNPIYESLSDWVITGKHFLNNPASLRAGLPGIFREIFKLDEEEDAA